MFHVMCDGRFKQLFFLRILKIFKFKIDFLSCNSLKYSLQSLKCRISKKKKLRTFENLKVFGCHGNLKYPNHLYFVNIVDNPLAERKRHKILFFK